MTYYETAGPPAGPAVVLVPGFSTPLLVWERTAPALAAAGFHVVAYDLYGRGRSDRLHCAYDLMLYERQIRGLIEALAIHGPVDVVGFSMGAQICAHFADRYPARVRRVVFIDPAGFGRSNLRPRRVELWPGIGELLQRRKGPEWVADRAVAMFLDPQLLPLDFRDRVLTQARVRGTGRALLSTRRSMPQQSLELYRSLAGSRKPVMVVWGREDKITPFAHLEKAASVLPGAEFLPVDKAGHAAQYERPETVNPAVVDFLRR